MSTVRAIFLDRHPGAGRDPDSPAAYRPGSARCTRHIHVARPTGRLRRSNRQSCRFSRERATFVAAKVAKNAAPGTTVSTTSSCLDFAALLAPSGPARTSRHIPVARPSLALRAACGVQIGSPCRFSRTSVCSNIRALLPLGAAMLGVVQARWKSSSSATAFLGLRFRVARPSWPWSAHE